VRRAVVSNLYAKFAAGMSARHLRTMLVNAGRGWISPFKGSGIHSRPERRSSRTLFVRGHVVAMADSGELHRVLLRNASSSQGLVGTRSGATDVDVDPVPPPRLMVKTRRRSGSTRVG
jgi:hypothetical protein